MPALNRVQLIGYLGRDPETRYTPHGKTYCTFSVAVTQRWRSGESNVKEHTDWFTIEAWGRLGEVCQKYLSKGKLVYLEGKLRTGRYEHEGETRYFTRVLALRVQMLDRRPEEAEPALEEIGEPEEPEIES